MEDERLCILYFLPDRRNIEKDITTKDLVSNNDVFADVANVTMPVKDMGYTYTGYAKQAKEIIARNNAEKKSAYTEVLHAHQKLMPIATFVLYFGTKEWKEPLSLMDILDIPEEEKDFWKNLIHDYPIHVIPMVGQPKEVRERYQSDFGIIADYLAYYKDKNKLDAHIRKDTRKLIHVEQVLDMLQAFSSDSRFQVMKDAYMELEKKGASATMCLLLDMCEEKGIERGIEKGMKQQAIAIAINLLDTLDIPIIAKKTGLSIAEVEQLEKDSTKDFVKN